MFDPRQRQQQQMGRPGQGGMPMQRPGWAQQLGQGLAAQPQWGQPMPQGGPPPGVRFMPPGGGMPPQAAGPDGRPMAPPGAGFMHDNDQAIRQALMRGHGRPPVMPEGGPPQGAMPPPPQGAMPPQAAPEGQMQQGQHEGEQDDPRRMPMQGGGGYR